MKRALYIISSLILIACSNSSNNDTVDINDTDYSALKLAQPRSPTLTPVQNETTLANYLRNGLRLSLTPSYYTAASLNIAGTLRGSTTDTTISSTNSHEVGIGEPELLSYDGNYLYLANTSYTSRQDFIRILRSYPSEPRAEQINELLPDAGMHRGMYLHKAGTAGKLLTLSGNYFYTDIMDLFIWPSDTSIVLFDVTDPSTAFKSKKIHINGNLIQSRKVDNLVYLVTQHYPNVRNLVFSPQTDVEKIQNERLIRSTNLSNLLPQYREGAGISMPFVSAEDCLVHSDMTRSNGISSLIVISVFDLNTEEFASTKCMTGNVDGISMSKNALYTSSSVWDKDFISSASAIHKFELTNVSVNYIDSLELPGDIFGTDIGFRMNEFNNYLRVVSSRWLGNNQIINTLHIIAEQNKKLSIISELPNNNSPEPIGKPGEQIYSVRFYGDRGYIVTFQQTDPLYVFDLSNPYLPKTTAALEVSGFSTYMHPWGKDFLFTMGYEANSVGLQQGVKLELFDVRNEYLPASISKILVGERRTRSPVDYDLQNITHLNTSPTSARITVPITVYQNNLWQHHGLYLFDLSTDPLTPSLNLRGAMIRQDTTPQMQYDYGCWLNRSVIHGDTVFYLCNNNLYTAFWQTPEQLNGPF